MKELLLKVEDLKELLAFAQEMPTKYGMPLMNFINGVAQKRIKELEAITQGKETPVETEVTSE